MKLKFKDLLKIGGSIFLLYLAINHWRDAIHVVKLVIGASSPLIIGCIIAYLVNIIMANYEKMYFPDTKSAFLNKSRRPVCMLLAFLSLAAVVTLVVWLVVPQLVSAVGVIVEGIPGFIEGILTQVKSWDVLPADILAYLESTDWQSQLSEIVKFVGTGIGSVVEIVITAVTSIFDWIVTALIGVIFSIYVLASKENLAEHFHRVCRRYLSEKVIDKMDYVFSVIDDCFHRYIVGQCVEAVILGVLCGVGMAILKLPYAMMVGALVAFTALIPIAGAYIGAAVGAFMILTVDPFKALMFIVFIIVLQQLEGNLIYPRVVGSSMGLPGIWVLAAVAIGGGIMGIAGMLLGVPLAAVIYRIVADDVKSAEAREQVEAVEKPEAAG